MTALFKVKHLSPVEQLSLAWHGTYAILQNFENWSKKL
jgi:hypothetical protein